jgi:isoamylase
MTTHGVYFRRAAMAFALVCVAGLIFVPRAAALGPDDLGATVDRAQSAITFRVFSSRATRVEVWIYDKPFGGKTLSRDDG